MAAEPSGEPSMPGRRSGGGGLYAADFQRGRLLSAMFSLVGERGYEGVTVRRVSERAGMSNRTFYECFSDREDCFLAAFNHAVAGLELEVRAGWESELGWTAAGSCGAGGVAAVSGSRAGGGAFGVCRGAGCGPAGARASRACIGEPGGGDRWGSCECARWPALLPVLVGGGRRRCDVRCDPRAPAGVPARAVD